MREANGQTFDAIVREDDALVVAYFWGDDCPNCDVFKADLPALLEKVPNGIRFVQVNAYVEMELARRFGLFGVPAFLLFHRGKLIGRMSEYYGRQYWLTVLEEQQKKALEKAAENPGDRQRA
ncbi:MAG: thioredoxin family protein [Myxococcaceae bacterium]